MERAKFNIQKVFRVSVLKYTSQIRKYPGFPLL